MDQDLHADATAQVATPSSSSVSHFRQILFWPVQLISVSGQKSHDHAEAFAALGPNNPWRIVEDEFTGDPAEFQERHYSEFVTFLPPVQRFIYGQGSERAERTCGNTPIKVMRRTDVAAMRVTLTPDAAPIELKVAHVDLYFFFDIDIAILALELYADNLSLAAAQDVMFRLGRLYPSFWHKDGAPGHCALCTEWLSASGAILASSDFEDRKTYLAHVGQHRSARLGRHWEFLLKPLVPLDRDKGTLRYRQLEYYRMPLMAYLALDDADALSRADYVRLGHVRGSGKASKQPLADHHLTDFEAKHCYDRYHEKRDPADWPSTRYMSCNHALVVTGDARNAYFVNGEHGLLNSFRHQHFMLFMVAHFQKAALLMFSDRLAEAVNRLDIRNPQAVLAFRSATREALETFLRFTHRYWFHVVSNQDQARDLFDLCRSHLDLDRLYEDVRQEVQEMSQYLENEAMRRQNESVARLTVVTAFGLIGTVATGFLGMNLFDHTGLSGLEKVAMFAAVFVPTLVLTFYTIAKSQRLSSFLDALGNETIGLGEKLSAFVKVWRR
ncbi:MAG: CorA family divalent cation transporter [Hyphomicrobiaceae bacterium]|nr:CorA family divalent cation transporter [Hyphomicrobiaceae bacterium]